MCFARSLLLPGAVQSVSQSVYYSGYDNKIKTVLNALIARLRGVPWRQEDEGTAGYVRVMSSTVRWGPTILGAKTTYFGYLR